MVKRLHTREFVNLLFASTFLLYYLLFKLDLVSSTQFTVILTLALLGWDLAFENLQERKESSNHDFTT